MTVREIFYKVRNYIPEATIASVVAKINEALLSLSGIIAKQTVAFADFPADTTWIDIPSNVVEISQVYVKKSDGTYKQIPMVQRPPATLEGTETFDDDLDIMWYQREKQFCLISGNHKYVTVESDTSNFFQIFCKVIPTLLDITDSNIADTEISDVSENVQGMILDYILWQYNLELANRPAVSEVDIYNKNNYIRLAGYYEKQFKSKAYKDETGRPKPEGTVIIPPKVYSLR